MVKSIGVIGIGNPLRRDDGIGIVLLDQLRDCREDFLSDVSLVDGGIGGMNILHLIDDFDIVIFIDAIDFHAPVGEICFFSFDDVKESRKKQNIGTHVQDVLEVLYVAQKLGSLPEKIFIFGVQPSDLSYGVGVSSLIEKKLQFLTDSLKKNIKEIVEKYQ
jgi:hydrogenase maturation protease